jgi:hypothetical protein
VLYQSARGAKLKTEFGSSKGLALGCQIGFKIYTGRLPGWCWSFDNQRINAIPNTPQTGAANIVVCV